MTLLLLILEGFVVPGTASGRVELGGSFALCTVWIVALMAIGTTAVAAGDLEVRPPERDTVFVDEGVTQTAVIGRMAEPQIARAVRKVAEAIGHDTEIIDEKSVLGLDEDVAPELQNRHLVLVGNAYNNRAIFRLYIRELALCDEDYPGTGGWIIRTVCDPWAAGHNAVIVGASDNQGLQKAADEFENALSVGDGTVTLPWAWRFESGVDADGRSRYSSRGYDWDEYRETITYVDQPVKQFPADVIGQSINAGQRYYQTGGENELRRFRMAIEELQKLGDRLYESRRVEFSLKDFIIAWERMEVDPSFSETERSEIASFFYDLGCLWESRYWSSPSMSRRVEDLRPITNHPSNGTLGFMRLGLYLLRRCEMSAEVRENAEKWVSSADAVFNAQEQSFKPGCDANGYQWWTLKHMLKYATWRPDYDVFYNGNVRLMTDLLLSAADNMGNAAGYGDVGSNLTGFSTHSQYICKLAARHYGDGCARWIAEYLGGRFSGSEMPVEALKPVDSTGVTKIPWSRAYYDDLAKRGGKYQRVPWQRTFDKIAFRAGFDPKEPYLLLDGIGGMGHGHDDCNAITRVTADEKIWLIDDAYALKTMYDHNGVSVARNGLSPSEAYAAELHAFADLLSSGMTRSESPANGLMWNRNIFWIKDGYFVIVDDLECKEAGDYQTNCTWRCATEGTLDGDTYRAMNLGDTMTISSDGTGRAKVAWERHPGEAPAHVLREVVSGDMQPGDTFTYANLLAWPEADSEAPQIVKVAEDTWRVDGDQDWGIVAAGPQTPESIQSDAQMMTVTSGAVCLVNATECTILGSPVLRASAPVTVELNRDGRGLVISDTEASVSLRMGENLTIAGKPASTRMTGELTVVDLTPGRHMLASSDSTVAGILDGLKREASSWEAVDREVAEAGEDVPTRGRTMWTYTGVQNVVAHEVTDITADPACKPGRSSPVDQLVDGDWSVSHVSGIWSPGQTPVVTIDLGERKSLDRVTIYTWEGMSSHRLDGVDMAVSNTINEDDFQTVPVEFPIVGRAERDISRIRQAENLDTHARYVKLTFKPASDEDGAYIAEVILHPSPGESSTQAPINDFATWDIDGDGADEVLVAGADGKVHCLGPDGTTTWQFEAPEAFNAVWAGEIDGETVLLAGCDDNHLYRLDAEGREIWKQVTYDYRPRRYETGKVKKILVERLIPDGDPIILAGADNWELSAFTLDGQELWHCWYYSHSTTFLTTGDINGDGVREIFQGTSFADTNWFDAKGEESHFQRCYIGPAEDGVTADMDDDGKDEMIAVGQKGVAAMTVHRNEGADGWDDRIEWRIDTGCPQTCIAVAGVDGDGVDDIVTAGKNGFIRAVGRGGETHWVKNAGNSINDLLVADIGADGGASILAASDNGTVQVWSMDGRLLERISVGKQVVKLQLGDIDGDGSQEILAVTVDDILHAVEP
ncbi:MAG: hypothetical protein R6V19_11580 [Armatimonadota bacterium]